MLSSLVSSCTVAASTSLPLLLGWPSSRPLSRKLPLREATSRGLKNGTSPRYPGIITVVEELGLSGCTHVRGEEMLRRGRKPRSCWASVFPHRLCSDLGLSAGRAEKGGPPGGWVVVGQQSGVREGSACSALSISRLSLSTTLWLTRGPKEGYRFPGPGEGLCSVGSCSWMLLDARGADTNPWSAGRSHVGAADRGSGRAGKWGWFRWWHRLLGGGECRHGLASAIRVP